jgi:plastocyanin
VLPDIEPQPEPIVHRFQDDGLNVTVLLAPLPLQVGFQNLTVRVAPVDREMPENAAVGLRLTPPSASGETSSRQLERLNATAWSVEDALFTERGNWTVLVFVQGRGTYVSSEFELSVAPAGPEPEPRVFHGHERTPESPLLQPGDSFQWTPPEAGTFEYHCHPHPWMTGVVRVVEGDRPPTAAHVVIVDGEAEEAYEFQPREIAVHVDDTLVWRNNGTVAHTVTVEERSG